MAGITSATLTSPRIPWHRATCRTISVFVMTPVIVPFTNDQKRPMSAAQQLRGFCEQVVNLDRDQALPGDRQYTRDTHCICPDWMLARCLHRSIRRMVER